MIIHWKAVQQYFTVVLFVFQFYPDCNFGKFINFVLGTAMCERVKVSNYTNARREGVTCRKGGEGRGGELFP